MTAVKIIQSVQAEVRFLPAYSPDLNPIEKMQSKLKQIMRGVKPRTSEELFQVTGADDAQGWFALCGYVQDFLILAL